MLSDPRKLLLFPIINTHHFGSFHFPRLLSFDILSETTKNNYIRLMGTVNSSSGASSVAATTSKASGALPVTGLAIGTWSMLVGVVGVVFGAGTLLA